METPFLQMAIDGIGAHVAVVNSEGVIVFVNRAWRRFGEENNLTLADHGVGSRYYDFCPPAMRASLKALLAGPVSEDTEEYALYPCDGPTEPRRFQMRARPVRQGNRAFLVISHENVSKASLAPEPSKA